MNTSVLNEKNKFVLWILLSEILRKSACTVKAKPMFSGIIQTPGPRV